MDENEAGEVKVEKEKEVHVEESASAHVHAAWSHQLTAAELDGATHGQNRARSSVFEFGRHVLLVSPFFPFRGAAHASSSFQH